MLVWVIKMLYYNKIYVSEGIDINKTNASKECDIFHYWYFLAMKSYGLLWCCYFFCQRKWL